MLLDGTDASSRELEPEDCRVIRLGVRKLLSRSAWQASRRLRAEWSRIRPDIVQSYFLDSSYFSVPLARWCGVPSIIRVRNNLGYWLNVRHRVLNRVVKSWVDLSLTNSEPGREKLIRDDRLDESQVVSIPNGVDLERFEGIEPPRFEGTIRVGCVANLRKVKNIDGLMRAASHVVQRSPTAKFVIAGDGDERQKLEALKAELNLSDRFEFVGSVSDIPAFLSRCDVAVLPSHSEGMSNALLEYMAAGRAIVATDVGANSQLVRNQVDGLIVPAGKDDDLAVGILNLLANPDGAIRMARSARERVEQEFSREAMKRTFEEFYQSVFDGDSIQSNGRTCR